MQILTPEQAAKLEQKNINRATKCGLKHLKNYLKKKGEKHERAI